MKKYRRIGVITLATLSFIALIALASISAQAENGGTKLSDRIKINRQLSKTVADPESVVAKVNGIPITKKVYHEFEIFAKSVNDAEGKPAPTKNEIVEMAAKPILAQQEAEKLGLTVTDEEIDAEIEKERSDFDQAPPEAQQDVISYYKAYGIDFNKYWHTNENKKSIKFKIMMRKLNNRTNTSTSLNDNNNDPTNDNNAYMNKLVENSSIEVLK
jgi:hypothetical protein